MVLSSTTEAGNHKYFNRQESRDSFSTLSLDGDTADIQNDYIRLADINYDDDFNKEKEKHNNRKPLYVAPQNFNFRNVKDNNDQVLDIEQHADAPIEISHAPPLQLYKEPEPGAVLKPPSTFSSQWSAYLPPGLPEEPLRSTYEVEYSKRNFHGNEWYDQNRYYPKELIRQNNHHRNHRGKGKKTQAQKEISLIETSELYPYPSENDFAYIKDIPGIPIERSHTVSKRELIEGDKNIQILNPESVIVYPRKSDVVNVGVYPRSNLQSVGEQERTAVVIALRQEETESGDAEESKIHPRPFSLSTQDVDTVNGDASKPSFEVLYSQNHYTGPNNSTRTFDKGPYTVDIGTSHSEDLPRFVNHQIPFPQPHFVQENYYKDQLPNPYNNIIFKKYPQSINDKLNNDDIEHSQFRKAVKLGNALNELQIFKQHGNSRDNSFINSNNRVPDIIKYRSDIDKNDEERRFQYRFNDINLNAQRPITQIRHEINTAQIPESAGRKLVELSYRKCLLGKGSPLSGDGLSLVSWTLTPVKMFGGVGLKIANPSCGLF